MMKSPWFLIFSVAALLGLLSILAFLQYRWLGQISDGERTRLQRSVQSETERFAEDFNREIQGAYFNFQIKTENWRSRNWREFNQRYASWYGKTSYPNLIKDFYFVELGENQTVLRFSKERNAFAPAQLTESLKKLKSKLSDEKTFQSIVEEIPALLLPVYDENEKISRILVRTANLPPVMMPKKCGVLVIELDEDVIKNQLFPDLVKKHFSDNESANFRLAITNKETRTIFQTSDVSSTDASAKLFNLSPDNFNSFANRDLLSKPNDELKKQKTLVFSRVESQTANQNSPPEERRVEIQASNSDQPRVRIFDGQNPEQGGVWILSVQHTTGSLEQFISETRNKNLAISFGILGLLAFSVILILVSAQRAKFFAQRQVDFVSSVSHEFRTPLAVIYSAGENLADGVVKEEFQVLRYGDLIKSEGRKISKMIEQILDFAGTNSGNQKYDWSATNVKEIIENALAECQPALDEKEFEVEKNIAENLPKILADQTAINQAIQNLIINSIKYSNGQKHLKISAQNVGGKIKILIEDRGIGIASKDLKHIFEPFYRAKSVVDEQIHGNGLGLSLVKQTIKKHGGKIKAESEIGQGSRFTIELPETKIAT